MEEGLKIDLNIGKGNKNSNSNITKVSSQVWKNINNNSSSVYLHILLLKYDSNDEKISEDILITVPTINKGDALYGAVQLIKHDKIPRKYRFRYLLSDFGRSNKNEFKS